MPHFKFVESRQTAKLIEGASGAIDRLLSIPDPTAADDASAGLWDGKIHYFDRRAMTFPAGLLANLCYRLKQRGHTVEVEPDFSFPRIEPVTADCLVKKTLRDYQLEMVNIALEKRRGIWKCAPNSGKSTAISALCQAIVGAGGTVLVVVPTGVLLEQTGEEVQADVGRAIRVTKCGSGYKNVTGHVTVGTYQTLGRHCAGVRGANKQIAEFIANCSCVIIDEGHHAAANQIRTILRATKKAIWRIGCTGSVDKSDLSLGQEAAVNASALKNLWDLESCLGQVIYEVRNQYLIDNKISARPRIVVIDDPAAYGGSGMADPSCVNGAEIARQIFLSATAQDPVFLRTVATIAAQFLDQKRPPFIFSYSVDLIENYLKVAPIYSAPVEAVHGDLVPDIKVRKRILDRFAKNGDFSVVCSTVFDEGVSVPQIRGGIFMGQRKSPRELIQRAGRLIRRKEDQPVVNLVDFSFPLTPQLNNWWKAREAIYMDEGFEIVHIERMEDFFTLSL